MRQHAPQAEAGERRAHRRRDAEHGEERRPLGEDHVLEEVRGQEVVQPEVMQGRPERDREQHHRAREADDAPPRSSDATDDEEVEQRERRYDDRRVDVRLPGVGRVGVREEHARKLVEPREALASFRPLRCFHVRQRCCPGRMESG